MILDRILPRRAGPPLAPADTLWLRDHVISSGSQAGKHVSVEEAFTWDAVWACVSLIANAAKQMPICVYQDQITGTRRKVRTVWQSQLLGKRPNAEHFPSIWKATLFTHLLSWGNFYIGKEFDNRGRIENLWPIRPDLVRIGREGGRKVFYVKASNLEAAEKRYTADQIIHGFGFSLDGLNGLSPIGMMREAVGAGLGMDEYLNTFYANATILSGILTTDQDLSDDARGRVEKGWKRKFTGSRNAHKTPILEGGLKYQPMGLPMKDAQFVEAYNLGVQKIARSYGIPPSRVGAAIAGDSFTYKNVESDDLLLLKHGVAPWLVPFEEALNFDTSLFPPHLGCEFDTDVMLRTDTKTRYDAFSVATGGRAWMKPGEVRDKEGLPPDPSLDELPPAVRAPGEPGSPPARPLDGPQPGEPPPGQ